VPDGLQQIVNWMVAKDPTQRYPSPERAAQALHVFLSAGVAPQSPSEDASLSKYLIWLEGENDKPAGQPTLAVPGLAVASCRLFHPRRRP